MDLKRLPNENEHQYIWRIGQAKDAGLIDNDWDEIAEVINEEFRADESEYKNSCSYRKPYASAKAYFLAGCFNNINEEEYLKEMDVQKRELERLKIQYQDQRNAWRKQNYIDARVEHRLDNLEAELRDIGKVKYVPCEKEHQQSENDLLVILSDLHIGQTFSSTWGEYNTDIATKRMKTLLQEVINIKEIHNSQNVYVTICGDLISGNIHKSIQVTNTENVIKQIKIATQLISDFLFGLSLSFDYVFFNDVAGNHSRIDRKEDSLHDDRLDCLVSWGVNQFLHHINNIKYIQSGIDTGIADFNIRGKQYVSVHGDYDSFNQNGVGKLVMHLGYIPYAILYGHLHTCAVDESGGIKMIRGGSLAGSGDQYTIEKRLSGKPSQMVCVCNDKGVGCYYPIVLD